MTERAEQPRPTLIQEGFFRVRVTSEDKTQNFHAENRKLEMAGEQLILTNKFTGVKTLLPKSATVETHPG